LSRPTKGKKRIRQMGHRLKLKLKGRKRRKTIRLCREKTILVRRRTIKLSFKFKIKIPMVWKQVWPKTLIKCPT
jgi:hypothetical protein